MRFFYSNFTAPNLTPGAITPAMQGLYQEGAEVKLILRNIRTKWNQYANMWNAGKVLLAI